MILVLAVAVGVYARLRAGRRVPGGRRPMSTISTGTRSRRQKGRRRRIEEKLNDPREAAVPLRGGGKGRAIKKKIITFFTVKFGLPLSSRGA